MAGVAVLVYDGDCGFCTRSALWLEGRARSLDVVPWQRADLTSLGLTADECAAAVQYVRSDRRASGAAAVASALGDCGQPYRALGSVIVSPVLRPLAERTYAWVAEHRHLLPGGTPACAASPPSDRDERWRHRTLRQGAGQPVPPPHR